MDSNKTGTDNEQFTGNELDEPESGKQFAGNELDESNSADQLPAKEADNPDSIIEKEPVDSNSAEIRKDLVSSDKNQPSGSEKKITFIYKIAAVIILVCLTASAAYFFILRQPEKEDKPATVKKTSAETAETVDKAVALESFIVPFENNKYYTYVIVDISFDVPEQKLRLEITEKQNELRRVIYDMLLNKIEGAQSVPAVTDIKNDIKSGINAVLENGKIQEVFITKFHAV